MDGKERRQDEDVARRLKDKVGLKRLVGESPAFLEQTAKIPLIARSGAGVLICGETGTGKEVVARAIHYLGPRCQGPFLPVNCGAIPLELVESELFGHQRSAFTGAERDRPGLVEEAAGGTLFLDEIDCLPLLAQVKLLRFLQEKEFRRLGSTRTRRGDVRVIAATNARVERAVEEGTLRRDLYYRLNVLPLTLPPLRERREDIPLLARHFLERHGEEYGRPGLELAPDALPVLTSHDWPGNVRELENVIERAVVLSEPRSRIGARDVLLPGRGEARGRESFQDAKARVIARFERSYIVESLGACEGNVSRAARRAGKNRRAFFELIRKHGIDVGRFRRTDR